MGTPLLIVCLLVATLPAQEPLPAAQGRLDLQALAKKVDPGETPAVLALVPKALVQRCEQIVEGATQAELDAVLRWGDRDDPLFQAVAIHVLGQSDAARSNGDGLLREILVCAALSERVAVVDELRRMLGIGDGEEEWTKRASEPAHRRACALAARLLREHADDGATVELLARLADLFGDATVEVRDEGMRRLGERASASHWGWHSSAMLRALDVGRAEASLAAAAAARPPESLAERRPLARGLFDLRRRLDAAKRHAGTASKPGLEGQIAHLRFLQAANPEAAVEESRKLIAAGVEHALPFSVIASEAALATRREEAEENLARASKLPGSDLLTVSVTLMGRILPQLSRLRTEGGDGMQALATALADCDKLVGEDPSDDARIYRWVRKELHWPEGARTAIASVLPQAIALQASMPDSLPAYQILLAAALCAGDAEAARAALLRPLPSALAALHDVAWLRASIYVVRDLRDDRAPVAAELDQVLGDLERVQQDPGDASYLRGVRTWWEATRPDAASESRQKARECFVAAQRTFGQPGLWRAASALSVADAALGKSVDFDNLSRAKRQQGPTHANDLVAYPMLYFVHPGIDMSVVTGLQGWVQAIDHDASRAAVQSACAGGKKSLGDAEGARTAAKIALQASAEDTPTRLSLGRGVVASGEFGFDVGTSFARPGLRVTVAVDFQVVPVVMRREQLQRLVDGK